MARSARQTRTRKDLLQAAARLMAEGGRPTLEAIAEDALVSRATAYRYFPGLEALLLEAARDVEVPSPEALFRDVRSADPVARLELVATALHDMTLANEASLRMMLIQALQHSLQDGDEAPIRQDSRTPLIEAALAPARREFEPAALQRLIRALGVVVGIEAMVVFKDVLRVDDVEARKIKTLMIRALVRAARTSRSGA